MNRHGDGWQSGARRGTCARYLPVCLLLAALLLVCAPPARAELLHGDGYEFATENGALSVSSNAGTTNWKNHAGIDTSDLKTVTFQSGVTEIREGAFAECPNLTTVSGIPAGLKEIGKRAFYACGKLTGTLEFVNVTGYDEQAFAACPNLDIVVSGGSNIWVDTSAFNGVRSVTWRGGYVNSVNEKAFANTKLTVEGGRLPSLSYMSGSDVVINGGTIDGIYSDSMPNGTLTVNGGTINRVEREALSAMTDVTINGGIIRGVGNKAFYRLGSASMTINGGTITGGGVNAFEGTDPKFTRYTFTGGSASGIGLEHALDGARFLVTATVSGARLTGIGALLDDKGAEIAYGLKDVSTDMAGKVYLWLQSTQRLKTIRLGNGTEYVYQGGDYLTVERNLQNAGTFAQSGGYAVKLALLGKKEGTTLRMVDSGGTTITSAAAGARIGMLVDTLAPGTDIIGLYLSTGESASEPNVGRPAVSSDFTYVKEGLNGKDIYRFYMPAAPATVYALLADAVAPVVEPNIITSRLPDGVYGQPYRFSIAAVGSSCTVRISGLPGGLRVNAADGRIIEGTPTAPGDYSVVIRLERPNSESGEPEYPATKTLPLRIHALGALDPPVLTPAGGAYDIPQSITITAPAGAGVYYTLDGSEPTAGSTPYTGGFTIGSDCVVRAAAVKDGYASGYAREEYTFSKAPVITTQPTDQSVYEFGRATFTIQAEGSPAPTYQWQAKSNDKWVDLSGATGASYQTNALHLSSSGKVYRCVVTNSKGSVQSSEATLTVLQSYGPAIEKQPVSQAAAVGETATFEVLAAGAPAPTYQWQRLVGSDWQDISGATSAVYQTQPVTAADDGTRYRCKATVEMRGYLFSVDVSLRVGAPKSIVITKQPTDQTVYKSESAGFSLTATGIPEPSCQWQTLTDGVWTDIKDALGATYTTPAYHTVGDAASFRCRLSNTQGTVYSNTVNVRVIEDVITMTAQPTNQSVVEGQKATFSLTAEGRPDLYYVWQKLVNGYWEQIIGAPNTSSYQTNETTLADNGSVYRCEVFNQNDRIYSNEVTLTVYETGAPIIGTQPTDVTVMEGESAEFVLTVSGDPAPTYQWQTLDGSQWKDIAGETKARYVLQIALGHDDGKKFRCVATNVKGVATSSEATLHVLYRATITKQPEDQTVNAGDYAVFTVEAEGNPAPTYQWRISDGGGWRDIAGAKSASYTTGVLGLTDSGTQYLCAVRNGGSENTSRIATLTVKAVERPFFTQNPSDQRVMEGQPATFTVEVTGNPAPTYQWQRNRVNIEGATSASYTIAAVSMDDHNAEFRCVAENKLAKIPSLEAKLMVTPMPKPPMITQHPASQNIMEGQPVTFTVAATGGDPVLRYQWVRNGMEITGATDASYTIAAVSMSDSNALFKCVVSNNIGSTQSRDATLNVSPAPRPPVITDPATPQTVTTTEGGGALFSVGAQNATAYQWFIDRNDSYGWKMIGGATGSSYQTPAATQANSGYRYFCRVYNGELYIDSPIFTLQVKEKPDIPVTGDTAAPLMWVALIILSGACLALARRRTAR